MKETAWPAMKAALTKTQKVKCGVRLLRDLIEQLVFLISFPNYDRDPKLGDQSP